MPNLRYLSVFLWLALLPLAGSVHADTPLVLEVGGGKLDIDFDSPPSPPLRQLMLDWIGRAAKAVTVYYGRYPVNHVAIHLLLQEGAGIEGGRASGDNGPEIQVHVGRATTAEDLTDDNHGWIMTHEMVHLALPSIEPEHHWLEEGLATYIEPIARVRAGELDAAQVWDAMVGGMPKGQPHAGDAGLDRTPTWGRTYWGGAMFCLLADIKIRQATHNRAGLETAMRGVLRTGGSLAQDWPLDRVLDVADRASGVAVLRPLYEEMKFDPSPQDLAALWRQLGIARVGGRIVFDDAAPLAEIRRAMMAP